MVDTVMARYVKETDGPIIKYVNETDSAVIMQAHETDSAVIRYVNTRLRTVQWSDSEWDGLWNDEVCECNGLWDDDQKKVLYYWLFQALDTTTA